MRRLIVLFVALLTLPLGSVAAQSATPLASPEAATPIASLNGLAATPIAGPEVSSTTPVAGGAVNVTTPTAATSATTDLIAAINAYRKAQGLPAIQVSPELTAVAEAHVHDLMANFATDPNYTGPNCVMHGWSNNGPWTGGCYQFGDSSTWPIMWNKPKEIANYPGNGYEILYESIGSPATASDALHWWSLDPPHNDVILNQGIWQTLTWRAMGVWVEDGWASVWFGEQVDPTAPTTGG